MAFAVVTYSQEVQQGLDLQHYGLALYRGGELQQAIDQIAESRLLRGSDTQLGLLVLALSHATAGNYDEARSYADRLKPEADVEQHPRPASKGGLATPVSRVKGTHSGR